MLRGVTDGVLVSLGYHRHDRGDWRLKRDAVFIQFNVRESKMYATISDQSLIAFQPAQNCPELIALFEKARAGNLPALDELKQRMRDRNWMKKLGDLGDEATNQLIANAAGSDVVLKAELAEQVKELQAELLGEQPSVLERLLVRRVLNGWITVQALEVELAAHTPEDSEWHDFLDRLITRAQKRLTEAAHELMRIRRLQAPKTLAQLTSTVSPTETTSIAGRPVETCIEFEKSR
jgi:hypothetical protein